MKFNSSYVYIGLFQKSHSDKMIIYNIKKQILNLFTKIKFSLETLNQFLKKLFSYCLNMSCYFSYNKFNMSSLNNIIHCCKICFNDDSNILLLPCRHICSCVSFTVCINFCPVCRCKIKGVIKVFFS